MNYTKGIDVSHWQGDIDWKKVKGDGIDFAFVKATDGNNWIDPNLKANASGANAAGLTVGVYHFARFGTVDEAKKEADFFYKTVKNLPINLPLVLDIEVDDMVVALQSFLKRHRLF